MPSPCEQVVKDSLAEREATRSKFLNDYEQGTLTEVSKIHAEGKEITTRLTFEYHQVLQTLKLEAEEQAAAKKAETSAAITELEAQTKCDIAQAEGEATKAIADAEANSNGFLLKARQFELIDRHLDVYAALVNNPETIVTDSDDQDFNKLLLSDSILAAHGTGGGGGGGGGGRGKSGGGSDHSALLGSLNVLRLAGSAYGMRSDTYIPSPSTGAIPVQK